MSAEAALTLMLAASMSFGACAKHDSAATPPSEPGAEQPARVPPPLLDIEAGANDLFDDARGDDWVKASEDLPRAEEQLIRLETKATRKDLPVEMYAPLRNSIASLRRAVESKDRIATMHAAADVGFAAGALEARLRHDLPVLVPAMERIGRAILVGLESDDRAAVDRAIARAETAWQDVRPMIAARAGRALATKTDRTIAELRAARGTDAIERLAEDLLEETGSMAGLFE